MSTIVYEVCPKCFENTGNQDNLTLKSEIDMYCKDYLLFIEYTCRCSDCDYFFTYSNEIDMI